MSATAEIIVKDHAAKDADCNTNNTVVPYVVSGHYCVHPAHRRYLCKHYIPALIPNKIKGAVMLEQWSWVAGIVVAAVAVVGLFVKIRSTKSIENHQIAKVSGQQNSVNQTSEIRSDGRKDHQ